MPTFTFTLIVEGLEVVRIADAGSGCSLMQDLPGH